MNTFEFFLDVHLLHIILRHTDNLSKTLQMTKMSAAEGQKLADMTVNALQVRYMYKLPSLHCLLHVPLCFPYSP